MVSDSPPVHINPESSFFYKRLNPCNPKGILDSLGFLFVFWLMGTSAFAQISFENTPAREVMAYAEEHTPFRFLFRDALIAGVQLSFSSVDEQSLLSDLKVALEQQRISMLMDESRFQIFLFQVHRTQKASLYGRVVDAETGASLPFATLSWQDGQRVTGRAANQDGYFQLPPLEAGTAISIQFVGYGTMAFTADPSLQTNEITVRLTPLTLSANPVLVLGSSYSNTADSVLHHIAFSGGLMQFGGEQAIRSVSQLPSVQMGGAFSNGLHVRGTKTDAFDVQLDGMSIFGPSHFFGLFDAFNPDALRAVGFYYAVTPATLSGPPGATLSFLTRTGSQQQFRGRAGISNTAFRSTIEGPIADGRGSWLISGRVSLLDQIDWLGNSELIQWGLDGNREGSRPPGFSAPNVVTPRSERAEFYDIHATGYYEFNAGYRLTLSGYTGANTAELESNRVFRGVGRPVPALDVREVSTNHTWGNQAASARLQHPVFGNAYMTTTGGFSRYQMQFSRDDFLYNRNVSGVGEPSSFVDFFGNENELLNVRLHQTVDLMTGNGLFITAGQTFQQHRLRYAENNAFDPFFDQTKSAWQLDPFVQASIRIKSGHTFDTGLRMHYFSDGDFVRLSPRLSWSWQPVEVIQISAGYSRNYQFLHSLTLSNYVMSEFWVMTSEQNGPSSSDNFTAGISLNPLPNHYIQIEGYYKSFRNVRLPKINSRALLTSSDFENSPWFSRNNAWSRGLEVLYRVSFLERIQLTNSYTWSVNELQNDLVNRGEMYHPEWDRTHQVSSLAEFTITPNSMIYVQWSGASGVFNNLSLTNEQEPERLDAYSRWNAGAQYTHDFGGVSVEIKVGVYNLFDQKNTLYRTNEFFLQTTPRPALRNMIVDVYDLGFMPSFDVSIRF